MAERCSATAYDPLESWGRRFRKCKRTAKVERDGKHYCSQHDPVVLQAKADAEIAARAKARKADQAAKALNNAAPDLLAACERGARALQTFLDFMTGIGRDADEEDELALRDMLAAIAKAKPQT